MGRSRRGRRGSMRIGRRREGEDEEEAVEEDGQEKKRKT